MKQGQAQSQESINRLEKSNQQVIDSVNQCTIGITAIWLALEKVYPEHKAEFDKIKEEIKTKHDIVMGEIDPEVEKVVI